MRCNEPARTRLRSAAFHVGPEKKGKKKKKKKKKKKVKRCVAKAAQARRLATVRNTAHTIKYQMRINRKRLTRRQFRLMHCTRIACQLWLPANRLRTLSVPLLGGCQMRPVETATDARSIAVARVWASTQTFLMNFKKSQISKFHHNCTNECNDAFVVVLQAFCLLQHRWTRRHCSTLFLRRVEMKKKKKKVAGKNPNCRALQIAQKLLLFSVLAVSI
jgi:hypothetical protein